MRRERLEDEKISVVIATLNSLPLLQISVPFWLNQKVHEVVVVDGGSMDGTEAYLLAVSKGDPRVQFVQELRPGLAVARNAGSRRASGDVLLHAGPDNRVPPDTLSSMLSELTEVSLVSCRTRVSTNSWYRGLSLNVSKARLSEGRNLPVVGTPYLGRKELFRDFPFDESVQHSDDTFFCEHIRAEGHVIVRVPEYCLETGFDTVQELKERYRRWGHSDAEYFIRLRLDSGVMKKMASFTRAFWVEVFSPLRHSPLLKYILAFPVLFTFGIWRFRGFISSLKRMDHDGALRSP
jgi:glycosyltransferase involved in cell wall biosynthesis